MPNRSKEKQLSLKRLKETMTYDPNTGKFVWIKKVRGIYAGTLQKNGYIRITIDRRHYFAHRLAWFYMTGRWPYKIIDHINHNKTDNSWNNLREVEYHVNSQNQIKAHSTKENTHIGAYLAKDKYRPNPWYSMIYVNGKSKYLGHYETPEEASKAYIEAKRIYHEGCTL